MIENLSRNAPGDVDLSITWRRWCDAEWGANSITVAPRNAPSWRDADLNETRAAQTLAPWRFADSPTPIRNVANMRVKETDRLAALTTELRKFGAEVDEWADGLTVDPTNRTLRG